ncbi:MAG TPA: DNA-3-methyladenine glycosylase [Pirellulales bacterium]|nr:DNA-3-methyladenine glycosylase [Pirellulales bacterium]
MAPRQEKLETAVLHLRQDKVLRRVIDAVGPFRLRLERDRFRMLARSIISQQISTAAARSIRGRLEALTAPAGITPASIVSLDETQLRSVGLSARKAVFIRDLAAKVHAEEIALSHLGRMQDEAVIADLVQIRGIGRWTAQMFLIFSLGRLDVFPEDDLGVRAAIRNLYALAELPDKQTARDIAARWRPYASVASWYCWRSLELKKSLPPDGRRYPV